MLRNRKGFTLIELLIVVVIIGILAAIAIPKFANTKEKAYIATMKSDLRNLATAEEGYFADNKAYVAGTASNDGAGTTASIAGGFVPSSGVTVTATTATGGWQAEAVYSTGTTKHCFIWVGAQNGVTTAKSDGEPTCA
jgi:prepilin-type N-terminal cleavage/methylation domain-containing protein